MAGIAITVKIDRAILDEIAQKVPNATAGGVEMAAHNIGDWADRIVPVDTGALQDSIEEWGSGDVWYVHADTEYAGNVEYGTSRMAAQPYMRPAAEGLDMGEVEAEILREAGL
jgi:HK97 gp10 family phage protein